MAEKFLAPIVAPKKPFSERLQKKLAASRFLTFSMLLHVVLVVMGGSVVLFKQYVEPPDFVAEGGVVGEVSAQPPMDQPPDLTQQTFTPDQPTISAPTVAAITSTTTAATQFTMSAVPAPVVRAISDKAITSPTRTMGTGVAKGLPSSMAGRAGGTARAAALIKNKGTEASEKAVMAGLHWLKQNQNPDGSWSNDRKSSMTGLATLCFLGHGETPESPEFGPTVKKALDWLLAKGTQTEADGNLSNGRGGNFPGPPDVYEHGIATYAVGEYYTMTKDERYIPLFKQAIKHIINGQAPDGGWQYGYAKGPDSDTSVSGWQIQALKSASLSELKIEGVDEALDRAMLNLKRVQSTDGNFHYRKIGDRGENPGLVGVGVLCTYFWKDQRAGVVKDGIEFLFKAVEKEYHVKYKGEKANLYGWYYDTQACLMFGGSSWSKWNGMFQKELIENQSPDGSWPETGAKDGAHEENKAGHSQIYRTTLCVLMLEVFYRYMPTTR